MTTKDRRLDRATARERELVESTRRELASTRRALGISRPELGASVGVSRGQIARFETAIDADVGL